MHRGQWCHPAASPIQLWHEVTVPWDFQLPCSMDRTMGDIGSQCGGLKGGADPEMLRREGFQGKEQTPEAPLL